MRQTTVVAAVIRKNARILVCRRRPDQAHPLKWEFPGGKVEDGEEPAAALARELSEELAIQAHAGPEIDRYEYCYPGARPILLIFYAVSAFEGELRNCVFAEIRWAEPAELPALDFLEGDARIVSVLARQGSFTSTLC